MDKTQLTLNPQDLSTLCQDYIALNLEKTISSEERRGVLYLRDGLPFLNINIADEILSAYKEDGLPLSDKVTHLFKDKTKVRLSRADLSHSEITKDTLAWISQHPIEFLDITGCDELSRTVVGEYIGEMAPHLQQLILGNNVHLLSPLKPNCPVTSGSESPEPPDGPMEPSEKNNNPDNQPIPGQDSDPANEPEMSEILIKLSKANNLRMLSMRRFHRPSLSVAEKFLRSLTNIQYLDLEGCQSFIGKNNDLQPLLNLKSMKHLSRLDLHNVIPFGHDLNKCLPVLTTLKSLRHLDISSVRRRGTRLPSVVSQDEALQKLVSQLPDLDSLDLSGTHLCGFEVKSPRHIPIPGLDVDGKEFEFLGLLDCLEHPCDREGLPAKRVAGDHNLNQVIESLKRHKHRIVFCIPTLDALYQTLKGDFAGSPICAEILSLVCECLRLHTSNLRIQMVASAVMCCLFNCESQLPDVHSYAPARLIRRAVRLLHNSMTINSNTWDERGLTRNILLALFYLTVPQDVMFIYSEIVESVLETIRICDPDEDEFLQRISLLFLNKMMRGEGADKHLVGNLAAVQGMLSLIKKKLNGDRPDDVMNLAWTTLWNITDETPKNCERFLITQMSNGSSYSGMSLFIQCYNKYCTSWPESQSEAREELLRNMMGLMGNVAEVKELRPQLSQASYLSLFKYLLDSSEHGIEISYHAAGIICHILCDNTDSSIWSITGQLINRDVNDSASANGSVDSSASANQEEDYVSSVTQATDWEEGDEEEDEEEELLQLMDSSSVESNGPTERLDETLGNINSKEEILQSLVAAMERWDKKSERCINYRSFLPILNLLQCEHTVEVRQWACWVLCNLTTVYPDRYCPMLKDEGGIQMLEDIMSNPAKQTGNMMMLAACVLHNCEEQLDKETTPTSS